MSDRYWRDDASCATEEARLFDPFTPGESQMGRQGGHTSAAYKRLARAAAICRRCPVAAECYDDAKRNDGTGIRAGVMFDNGRPVDALRRVAALARSVA